MAIKNPSVPLPKVSVLVPCYNVEKYVGQCINSILCQTLEDIEIICIDDGSTDRTGEILDGYAKLDGRMRVIHKENGGYGKAMNTGLDAAKGEYIGILEPDDLCAPHMYAALYDVCKKNELDMAKCNTNLYWSENYKIEKLNFCENENYNKVIEPIKTPRLLWGPPSIWAAIYNKKMLIDNNIKFRETPGASFQDASFNMKVWCSAKKIIIENIADHFYRQDNKNSSCNANNKIFEICDEYEDAIEFAKVNKPELLPYIEKMRFSAYIWNLDRIDPIYKKIFLIKIQDELNKSILGKNLDKNLFTQEELIKYNELINRIN